MPEEKELTIEEMKSLVSLATLLPALLDKIAAINKDIAELKTAFNDIRVKFNNNTEAVIGYKNSVDDLIEKQPNIKAINADLNTIKQSLLKIEMSLDLGNPITENLNKKAPVQPKATKNEKPKDKDQDKVEEIVDKILEEHGGRKTRLLTIIDIKNGFKVDDEIANKVLKWFEDHNMYDSKMHKLTFPKK